MVLLDGKLVEPSAINPSLHKFIGMFRPPTNVLIPGKPVYAVICLCGEHLQYRNQCHEHYAKGCLDTPQYVSIIKVMPCETCGAVLEAGRPHECSRSPCELAIRAVNQMLGAKT